MRHVAGSMREGLGACVAWGGVRSSVGGAHASSPPPMTTCTTGPAPRIARMQSVSSAPPEHPVPKQHDGGKSVRRAKISPSRMEHERWFWRLKNQQSPNCAHHRTSHHKLVHATGGQGNHVGRRASCTGPDADGGRQPCATPAPSSSRHGARGPGALRAAMVG